VPAQPPDSYFRPKATQRASPNLLAEDFDITNPALGVARVDVDLSIIRSCPALSFLLLPGSYPVNGSPLSRFFDASELSHIRDELARLADPSVDAVNAESCAIRGDSSTVSLQWAATAVRKEDWTVDHYVVMFQDVTNRHHVDAIAAANLDTLERLNRLKTEFLTMISHEIRTALVGIQGFSELIQDAGSLDVAEAKEFAKGVFEGARRLDRMLEKMLQLDRQPESRALFSIRDVSLNSVIGEATATAAARDRKHRIATELEPNLPLVKGDWTKLSQLITILLNNAIKYSPEGSDILIVSRSVAGAVELTVRDHGIGMPADFDQRVFGRYRFTADNPATEVAGSGLGLPIARQIVDMHGGAIWFESESGAGTNFHFTIPARVQQ